MLQPIPYVIFNGNCEEAMRFYERVLDGKLERIVRFADMNMGCSGGQEIPAEQGQRVAHARLELEGHGLLFGGDCPATMKYEGIRGVNLTLSYDTVEQAQRVFAALAEGGNVIMPIAPSMWAKAAGMTTDRFGVDWIINGVLNED
jgi:PhnB protein